ncbi:neuronal acetylcholine receptor subunit alpha-7 [Sarcoptes scabiei]|nr:neuronal acetylcholine receptor subunit alpha-7 [Sarcoptes scabiei]
MSSKFHYEKTNKKFIFIFIAIVLAKSDCYAIEIDSISKSNNHNSPNSFESKASDLIGSASVSNSMIKRGALTEPKVWLKSYPRLNDDQHRTVWNDKSAIGNTESIYDPILSELSKRSFRDESSAYAEHSIMRFGRAPHSIIHFGKRQSIWPSRSESSTERNRLESTAFDLNESPHFVLVPIARSSSIYSLVSDDERAPELRRKKSPESRFGMNRGVFMHFG